MAMAMAMGKGVWWGRVGKTGGYGGSDFSGELCSLDRASLHGRMQMDVDGGGGPLRFAAGGRGAVHLHTAGARPTSPQRAPPHHHPSPGSQCSARSDPA